MTMHGPYGDGYGQDETSDLVRSLALSSAKLWEDLFERLRRIEQGQSELREHVAKIEDALAALPDAVALGQSHNGTAEALPPADVPSSLDGTPAGAAVELGSSTDRADRQVPDPGLAVSSFGPDGIEDLPSPLDWPMPEPDRADGWTVAPPPVWSAGTRADHEPYASATPDMAEPPGGFDIFGSAGPIGGEVTPPPPPPIGFQMDAPPPPPPPVGFEMDATPPPPPPPPVGFEMDATPPPPPPPPPVGFEMDAPPPPPPPVGFQMDAPPPPPPPPVGFEPDATPPPPPPPVGFEPDATPPPAPPPPPGFRVGTPSPEGFGDGAWPSPSESTAAPARAGQMVVGTAPPPPPPGFLLVEPPGSYPPAPPASVGAPEERSFPPPPPPPVGAAGPGTEGQQGDTTHERPLAITPDFFARAGRRRS